MHAGSQSQGNPHSSATWGPSAVRPKGEQSPIYRGSGPFATPQVMTTEQISQVRAAFVNAAGLSRDAGFDGRGDPWRQRLPDDEFLTDYLNIRTDEYGGSVANRIRLAAEVCRGVVSAVGADISVGIRISQGKVSDYRHRWAGGEDDAAVIFSTLR
jgi:2,4-dienoyl-CoA reductase-like NADH-dependent reductase (Old Yellow Enzyme family)